MTFNQQPSLSEIFEIVKQCMCVFLCLLFPFFAPLEKLSLALMSKENDTSVFPLRSLLYALNTHHLT
jgi:hypothetical protein